MALSVGTAAPAFALPDQDGKMVQLEDFTGQWVVLYFYPRDDTPGCTTEACEFTEGIQAFEKLKAVVLGVSPDSPESHRDFIQKHGLQVRLLSDPERQALQPYGAWGTKVRDGVEKLGVLRSTVLIDPEGKIARHWEKVSAPGHAAEVRAALEALSA